MTHNMFPTSETTLVSGPQKPLTPAIELTATANLKTQESILKSLCMPKDCMQIFLSPNRKKIYLYKHKVTADLEMSFQWLVDTLEKKKMPWRKLLFTVSP